MLKAKKLLREHGLRGKKRGIERRKGFAQGQRYKNFSLEFINREIFKIDEVIEDFKLESKHPYIQKLLHYMNDPRKPTKTKKFPLSWNSTSGKSTV